MLNAVGRRIGSFLDNAAKSHNKAMWQNVQSGKVARNSPDFYLVGKHHENLRGLAADVLAAKVGRRGRYAGELINNNKALSALALAAPAATVVGIDMATGNRISENYAWPYNPYNQEGAASQQLNPYNQAGMGMEMGLVGEDENPVEQFMNQYRMY